MEKRDGIFYGWVILSVALITLLLGFGIRNAFSVFYPTIVAEFGWGRGNTALMFSITIIVYGLVAPLAGSLVDRFGPRLVMPVGVFIVGGGVALCGTATAQWHFLLFYGVMGAVGLSLIGWTTQATIVSKWFVKKRGLVFGILGVGFGGSLVFASVAQFLISTFGWQTAYVIIGVCSIAIIAPLSGLLMRRSPQDKGLLPDGLSPSSQESRHLNELEISLELQGKWASTTWTLSRAMKSYQFWFLFSIAFCLMGVAETIAIAHQVFFFQDVGYAPMQAASIYSVFGIAFVLGNLCTFLSDSLGREKVFITSCLLSASAVSFLFLTKDTSQPWMAFSYAFFSGLGIGNAGTVLHATVADLFQGRHFGSIQGTIILGFALGGAIAPWLAGFLHDRTGSYFSTFLILLWSLLVSMVLMWLIAPSKIRPVSSKTAEIESETSLP
ncbi:MAG: MFS transporter [Deltaproteobacteria bacterium]|nr:MAG: MFS transporter [Deltaproteobacteria bacterium]